MYHFGRDARWQDTGRGGTLYYPIWLSYAAAVLEQNHTVKLVDAPAWNWSTIDILNDIESFNPNLIVLNSSFTSLNNDLNVASSLKKNSSAFVVLVGPPASQFSEYILRTDNVDFVARYEYDFTLKDLAHVLEEGRDSKEIKGISYKKDGKIFHNENRDFLSSEDLNKIPFVSKIYKRHLNIRDYFLGQSLFPEVQIFTGRGCPNRCTFCSWPETLTGRTYRVRSIQNVLDEFAWIEKNLPDINEIFLEDDTFTLNKKRVIEFAEGYRQRGLKISWACNARATIDYETMEKMRKANCRLVVTGFESGSNQILKNIKKGISVNQIKCFSRDAKEAGLLVHGDFVVGLPGETKETIKMTKNLIQEIKPDVLQIAVASPFPGTEFYEWCKKNNFLLTDDPNEYLDENGHQKAIISYPGLTNKEMVQEVDRILKNYYFSVRYIPIALRQILRRRGFDEMKRLWHSAKMFFEYSQERKH